MAYVNLHTHTEYSFLDGLGSIKDYVKRASQIGMPALAITDHGSLCGAPVFYHEARKAGVEPIIGSEFYWVPDATAKPKSRQHSIILARGWEGYQVLARLSSDTHRQFHYKPLLDRRLLEELGDDAQHLVCLSGCGGSSLSERVRAGDIQGAEEELLWWREIFPHYFIELQHHDTEWDEELNLGLYSLAKKYKVPTVITQDSHYVWEDDAAYHDILLAIQTASDVDDPERFRFEGHGFHLRTEDEMRHAFKGYPDRLVDASLHNTTVVAKLCSTRIPAWEERTWAIPRLPGLEERGVTSTTLMKNLVKEALAETGLGKKRAYRERAQMEFAALGKAGLFDYLLVTRDAILEAERRGIPVGPGRGSVCGTLLGYLIGIHKIDPVKYELMFERFYNPARPRMPDIDTDFGAKRRDELFTYVEEKYGIDNCVRVAAFQSMKVRATFRSLAKSYGVSYIDSNRLSKLLPEEIAGEESQDEWASEEFAREVIDKYSSLADVMVRLAGIKRAVSAHPAGIIIANPEADIRTLVPLMYLPSSKQLCGQFDLDAVEEMGLMKQDFLSLRTLETVAETVRLVEETTGEVLDPDSWDPDQEPRDSDVYKMLANGNTSGVFQFEGHANTRGVQQIDPNKFEDLVACTSLYRTALIVGGYPKIYLANRKAGEVDWIHPSLEPILGRTWGVVLYQEQAMEMAEKVAGFDMVLVDDIKEAIKHKRSELLASLAKPFMRGCIATVGMTVKQAKATWRLIKDYAGYGYNRSHAVAYTMLSYQTARLRCLYPREFYAALLRTVDHKEKRLGYLADAVREGMEVIRPDINASTDRLTLTTEGNLRFGFLDIAGIGPKAATKILAKRPPQGYESVEEVEEAVGNVGWVRALAESGALESLGIAPNEGKSQELLGWRFVDPLGSLRTRLEGELIRPHQIDDGDDVVLAGELVKAEKAKTKTGAPYMTWTIQWDVTEEWKVRLWSSTEERWNVPRGSIVLVKGRWDAQWSNCSIASPSQVRVVRRANRKTRTIEAEE